MKIKTKKIGMTQMWKDDKVIPVTILKFDDDKIVNELKEGAVVKVSGKSKGKGFQGVVKRHGFHGGPKSHGQKNRLRAPGSIGATAPQRVIKGKKMAGRMGGNRVTIKNLVIESIKPEQKEILVRGAVPGRRGTIIEINSASQN